MGLCLIRRSRYWANSASCSKQQKLTNLAALYLYFYVSFHIVMMTRGWKEGGESKSAMEQEQIDEDISIGVKRIEQWSF